MGQVTKVLLLLAVVVPVTAYVAGSLASPGAPPPADHSPVILRDAPADEPAPPDPAPASPARERQDDRERDDDRGPDEDRSGREGGDRARVVTPQPTPVGEDDDDEWDDDGLDDDDTDDERTDGDD
ncbi:hypothetical protein GCM10011376_28740 [Nocardioides flavus (ex Wang et al. 2016)]|uniref:Uncharacterized protein n=1 Tax=Nocardioides flavus (ex Wang et al. 2016) TaxID=2058780 RepID=A0ABQ3HNQ0_9ACTN|nr:hypothetical protein [Nocardioides flavus (ex Wang et al. 2016)]GHE18264.1 hypothetical protein GCM10011376_28740 [Nocardioides flavus (ex Wang et al. 2016)]